MANGDPNNSVFYTFNFISENIFSWFTLFALYERFHTFSEILNKVYYFGYF